jgi:hypothetical protein
MGVTVLYDEAEAFEAPEADAREEGDHLWLSPGAFKAATGWTLKPEGLCREQACVPLPADGSWRDEDGRVDLAAFAARFKRPMVRDGEHSVWAFGEQAAARTDRALSLEAPDFTLPDLDGRMHSLSDYRGMKVFLLSWGSY